MRGAIIVAVVAALVAGAWLERETGWIGTLTGAPIPQRTGHASGGGEHDGAQTRGDAGGGERRILYWVAPMDPTYRSDRPGKSPMGMDLVPVYADEGGGDDALRISPVVMQNLGVRTALAERRKLSREVHTVGYVEFDETRISHVHTRTEGWVERLHVKARDERVKRGQPLFELYSPPLVNAQEEYLQALASGIPSLKRASRERLVALGLAAADIERLARTRKVRQRVTFYAPRSGVLAALNVREGMYVRPATEVMAIADLSEIWVLAEVFEAQASWVHAGEPARAELPAFPGRAWEGVVDYVYPVLDARTRTVRVRLRFPNRAGELKPNMFAEVLIRGTPRADVVAIPREALIRDGRSAHVVLALGDGRFTPRAVVPGIESGEWVEVRSGLAPGERVVTSAQFLIDSEASLRASLERLDASGGAPRTAMAAGSAGQPAGAAAGHGEAEGIGVVDAVLGEDAVRLTHEPIPALGWPAMTMDLHLAEGLRPPPPGTRVRFRLQPLEQGYCVTAIEPVEGSGP